MAQFEKSKFGDANTAYALTVHNTYGPQHSGRTAGVEHGEGAERVLKINLTGQMLADVAAGDDYIPDITIWPGALQAAAPLIVVNEPFTYGGLGTDVAITIGGVALQVVFDDLTQAQGTYALTDTASALVGTQGQVKLSVSGATAGSTTAGDAEIILKYYDTVITDERAAVGDGV